MVTLVVYDVLGRAVETLVNGTQPTGRHELAFEAADLPPGVYFYQLGSGRVSGMVRMVVVR